MQTSLLRYWRSWGLWLLLLVAPIGARYMLRIDDGGVMIAVDGRLPEMTSAFLGVSLGIVVTTLLSPIAWLYLRSNTTRRQPWQIEETTAAPRVAIALGRFLADCAVMLAVLAVLNTAGWFLGWLLIPQALDIGHISFALWLVAAPSLIGLCALRMLFDARPLLRSGFGDFLYFVLWIASIVTPAAMAGKPTSLAANMYDFAGFVTPLQYGAPGEAGNFAISIGGFEVDPGRVHLDVMAGLTSPGYIESRLLWIGIAIGMVVITGLVYRPHLTKRRALQARWLATLLHPGPPPRVKPNAASARRALVSTANLAMAEFRLIGAGRVFIILAVLVAIAGYFVDFRTGASPAALLLLIFGLAAHAGRSEARNLISLTSVAALAPIQRRMAFISAGAAWTTVLALPALVRAPSFETLGLAFGSGAIAATIAIVLAAVSGSGFAPRLILLILWYGYSSYSG